jgi:hypothetical protein
MDQLYPRDLVLDQNACRSETGGSYKCGSGSVTRNTWVAVAYPNSSTKRWVAAWCAEAVLR